ncbi:hypothetical protein [Nannocystis pusilla]|uniref:hypothetical protein n=1 Tax=Nannocystis pusilla TaxID=889268 RepID=UPI003B784FBF
MLVGVGRVTGVGAAVEYRYKKNPERGDPRLRSVLWERNVSHSIRPGFENGFIFPYAEVMRALTADPSLSPEDYVAFAPDEYFAQYSYASELLSHDGAIASLITCASVLRRIARVVTGQWDTVLSWIDGELNRLWKARGAFPGLGSALTAFGLKHGSLIAHAIASVLETTGLTWTEDPWKLVDKVFEDPSAVPGGADFGIDQHWRKVWRRLPSERRELLKLLSRFTLTGTQAERFYHSETLERIGISLTTQRSSPIPTCSTSATATARIPSPSGSSTGALSGSPSPGGLSRPTAELGRRIDRCPTGPRGRDRYTRGGRQRWAHAAPRGWVIERVRARPMEPACPLSEDTLLASEDESRPRSPR